ncbi:MAG: YqgE/AlgH family protein [Chlorobi bacterium]|nr:YqgE/AlgH family protein [Chlorobiota bacterium]
MVNLDLDIFKIDSSQFVIEKGKVLISEPFTRDFYFKRSVVLLAEHNEEGTVGFILNKSVEIPVNEVLKNFPEFNSRLSIGGPVKPDTIYYIHTIGNILPNSLHVFDNLYWGGDFTELKEIIKAGIVKPEQIKFFVGYSGWNPKQLDNEISESFWLVSKLSVESIMTNFNYNQNDFWRQSIKSFGNKYQLWTTFPENPDLN